MQRAIFLDRDNTIIVNDGDLGDPAAVKLTQGAASAIASLRGLGYKIVVVTNQSGVARGMFTEADVDAVHNRISELIEQQANGASIDRFYYCPYLPGATLAKYDQDHPWRKPQPGMLLEAAKELKLDLPGCWMVGDSGRDIAAGNAAGVRTLLLGEGDAATDDEASASSGSRESWDAVPDYTAASMTEAARIIAQHLGPDTEEGEGDRRPVVTKTRAEKVDEPNPKAAPTYPAVAPLSAGEQGKRPERKPSTRPFKPWSIQPESPRDEPASAAAQASAPPARPNPADPPRQAHAPAPPAPEPVAETPRHEPTRAEPPRAEPPQAEPSRTEPPSDDPPADDAVYSNTDRLLNQILRQLKANHADYGDWSMYKVLAVGLMQPLALACVLIGMIISDAPGAWLAGAIFCQLAVISGLMLHAQR